MDEGYVYVSDEQPGPMRGALVGRRTAKPTAAPPWIVVDSSLDSVLVHRWPGRLYRVAVVTPAPAGDHPQPSPPRYVRALAVDVLAEEPAWTLFGPHGAAVVGVLDAAASLTAEIAAGLAASGHPDAPEAFHRAWERWLADQPDASPYLGDDHRDALSIPGAGPRGAPIGHGFVVLWRVVKAAAQRHGALTEEDGWEVVAEPWAAAGDALLHAAMGLGAPECATAADRQALTAAWSTLTG